MNNTSKRLTPMDNSAFRQTMRLLESSFQIAVREQEPFVALRELLKGLEDDQECPFFDWTIIEAAFEEVFCKRRTAQGAAFMTTQEIMGSAIFQHP
jgi:hypothetical protein